MTINYLTSIVKDFWPGQFIPALVRKDVNLSDIVPCNPNIYKDTSIATKIQETHSAKVGIYLHDFVSESATAVQIFSFTCYVPSCRVV